MSIGSRGLPTLSVISSVPTTAMIVFKVVPDLTRHTSAEVWLSMTLTTFLSMSMVTDTTAKICTCNAHLDEVYSYIYIYINIYTYLEYFIHNYVPIYMYFIYYHYK